MTQRVTLSGTQIPFTEFNRIWQASDLVVADCPELRCIDVVPQTARSITVRNCPKLTHFPSIPHTVQKLAIDGCPVLQKLPPLPPGLQVLHLSDTGIQVLPPRDWSDTQPTMPEHLSITVFQESIAVPWHDVYKRQPSQYLHRWNEYHRSKAGKQL